MLDADSGLGGKGVKSPVAESSAKTFEEHTEGGLSELKARIAEAFEGASDDEAVTNILDLARGKTEDVKANLTSLHKSFFEEGEIAVPKVEGIEEKIKGLESDAQQKVREAFSIFESLLAKTVLRFGGVKEVSEKEVSEKKETGDEKIARLEAEIKALEEKQGARAFRRSELTGKAAAGPSIREKKTLADLREEVKSLGGKQKETTSEEDFTKEIEVLKKEEVLMGEVQALRERVEEVEGKKRAKKALTLEEKLLPVALKQKEAELAVMLSEPAAPPSSVEEVRPSVVPPVVLEQPPVKELPLTTPAVLDLLKGMASGYENRRKTAQGEIDNLNKKTDLSDQEQILLRRWNEEAQDVRIRQARLVAELAKKPGVDRQVFEDAWQQMGGKESFEEILDLAASESMGERDQVAMEASVNAARRANQSEDASFDPARINAERAAKQGAMNETQRAIVMDQARKFIEQIEGLEAKISTARRDVDALTGIDQRIKKAEIDRLTGDLAERERTFAEFVKTSERSGAVIDVDALKEGLRGSKSVTPDTVSSPTPEPVTPGSPPVDQAPVVESSPVDEQVKKREMLLAKIRDNTEKLEALRAKRGAKDKPSPVESLLAISLKQLSIDLAKLDPTSDAKASIPPSPDLATPPAKDVIPDPAPPVIPAPPDAAPVKPDASAKLTVFEQRVADDEARLEKIQSLIDAWSSPENAGKPAMSKDGAIRAYVDWYRSLVVAERALVRASGDEEKTNANADIEARLKAKPRGDGSFQRLSETVAGYVSSTDDSKKMRGWKEVLASRQAVLDLLGESLNTRDGRGADAVATSAKKTPEPVPVDSPDAEIKKIPFEQRVAEDEARLSRIDALMKEADALGEGTTLDVGVRDWANWYSDVVAADKMLAQATEQSVRNAARNKILRLLKTEPSGYSSLEKTQETLDAVQARIDNSSISSLSGPDAKNSPEWGKAWEARKAVWALIMEGRAAQGLKTLDTKAAAAPKASTPDTKAAPDTQPSPDAALDPDPAVAAAEGAEHGPKTLQEAFDHENALVRRLSGDVDELEEIAGLDDAPLESLLSRAEESLQVFERLVKESDADEQMKLAAERAAFLESAEAQKSVEACFENIYAAISSLSPAEVKSETGFAARVEALTLLSELFPAVKERLPPLKKTLQETLALVPPGKELEKTPEELLERDRELISRLEKLVLESHAVGELDTPNPDQEHGELDRVRMGVQAAAELLELAVKEADPAAREKLLVEHSIILKDPKIQESAEAYMEKISDLLRAMEPDAVRADAQIRNRIETLEVLAEIFPDVAKKIPTLKTKTEQAGLVSLEDREAWQAEIDEMSLRLTTLQKTLEDAQDDQWYKENKASVDAGLAFRTNFQAGLTERVNTLLAAKTFAERRAADEAIVKFRRESALTPPPPLLPDASIAKTKIKIKELEKEVSIIKDEQGKKAAQEKQAELEALKRYTLILELQKDIRSEAALQSLPSDAEIVDRQARAKEENVFKKEGEIKAPTSVEGIRLGMQNNSEKQLAETTSAVRLARETRTFFSEALAGFNPHPEIGERFSPIYATWKEEQKAHFELLDKERHYNFLDHIEIGVTQALRSLDRLGSGSLSPEAAQAMWEGFPGVVRKLLAKGGEGDFASSLAPEDRNVETIKGWLYESLRKTTQDKLVIGQALEAALANADTFTGKTKRLAAETRAQLEREMTALEQERKRLEMELQQKQPGGVSHKEVRWTQEGHRLQFELMVVRQKMDRLKGQHKDLLDMEAIFNDPQREDPSVEDEEGYLALELRRESSERMVAIMQRQNERTAALTAQDKARTDALKANPGLMAKAIMTSASGKKSVEAKSNDGGGGKSEPGSLLNDLKNSWAAKLAKPFTDLFSGWFGGK